MFIYLIKNENKTDRIHKHYPIDSVEILKTSEILFFLKGGHLVSVDIKDDGIFLFIFKTYVIY